MDITLREIVQKMKDLNILHRFYVSQAAVNNHLYFGQLPILEFVMKNDRCTQKELAEMMGVSAPSIATSVKRMQKAGLLDKIMDKNDLRNNRLSLTEKGRLFSEKCRIEFNVIDKKMFAGFSNEECQQLYGFFDRLIANLSAGEIPNKNILHCMKQKTFNEYDQQKKEERK